MPKRNGDSVVELVRVTPSDTAYWFTLDSHIKESVFLRKAENGECFIIEADGVPVGILRYNLFWDEIPFLTLIYIEETQRRKGYGKPAMLAWEAEMKLLGYNTALTSTLSNEDAQHFYRALGYRECGCLILNLKNLTEPLEMFFIKSLEVKF